MKIPRTKEWRESQGLTQRELADMAGIGYVTVARIEGGQGANPPTARKIAKALGITVADLLEHPPVPLGIGPLPRLDPWGMLGVRDAEYRAAALEAATDEERERYVAELDDAIGRVELALSQDAANPPAEEDEKAAHALRLRKLWDLHNSYVVLRHEAEPVVFPEPQAVRELVPA